MVGTLYRHFPTRLELLWTVLEPKLRRVIDEMTASLGQEDPWEAFRGLLEVLCTAQAGDRAFADFLARRFPGDNRTEVAHNEICGLAHQVLLRAQEAGAVRPDVTGADLLVLLWASGCVSETTQHVAPSMWRRHLHLAMDGLRASNRSDLREPAWDLELLSRALPGRQAVSRSASG